MGVQDMDILIAVATGLGRREEDGQGGEYYVKDEECLENLKDLQRFMRRDHPMTRDVFLQLGQWNIVRRDLVPLITTYRSNYELVLAAVKVVVFLTMPPLPESDGVARQLEYLQRFKAAFLEDEALGVIVAMMEEPLAHLESGDFTDEDAKLVQLFLTLFRNLLAISDPSSQQTAASGGAHLAYMKEELLERFFQESVMDLLLALAPHVSHGGRKGPLRNDNLLLLEIVYYTFKDQRPTDLLGTADGKAKPQASKQDVSASTELVSLLKEERLRKAQVLTSGPPRHSFFVGTFARQWKDGAPSILRSNPFVSDFDRLASKSSVRSARMKAVAPHEGRVQLSAQVRGLLREHADQFLAGAYNILLRTVKDDIRRESSRVAPSDAVMFFKVAGFFTAYQKERLQRAKAAKASAKKKPTETSEEKTKAADEAFAAAVKGCGEIAATMDEEMFNMVVSRWREYADTIKEGKEFSALAAAGALLKDMIHVLDLILKTADAASEEGKKERSVANILLLKVFYDQTDTGILSFLVRLIKTYDRTKQPKGDIGNLLEMAHTILRMLEEYSKNNGEIRVLKKVRKFRRKKKIVPIREEQPAEEQNHPSYGEEQPVGATGEDYEWPVDGGGASGDEKERPVEDSDPLAEETEQAVIDTEPLEEQTEGPVDETEVLNEGTERPVEKNEQLDEGKDKLEDGTGPLDGETGRQAAKETEPLMGDVGNPVEDTEPLDNTTERAAMGNDQRTEETKDPVEGSETQRMKEEAEAKQGDDLKAWLDNLNVGDGETEEQPNDPGAASEGRETDAKDEASEGDQAAGKGAEGSPGNVRRDGFVESDPEDSSNSQKFADKQADVSKSPEPEESGVVRFDAPEESGVIRFDNDGPEDSGEVSQAPAGVQANDAFASMGVQEEYEEYEEEEEDDNTREVVLDAKACAFMFADNMVVRNLVWMLEGYRGNTPQVNYYIGRMLERVSKDCELEPMLYQLSFFSTFQKVLSDASFCRAKENALLTDVLTRSVRHFMAKAAEQPLVFMELLFWKTARECHLISQQYKEEEKRKGRPRGLGKDGADGACGPFDAQADERLKELFERFKHEKGTKDKIYDALEGRFRKSHISKRLKQLGLTGRGKSLFTPEQDDQLRQLFQKYKSNRSCVALIVSDLEAGFSRAQVARRLKQLDLSRPKRGEGRSAFDDLMEGLSDDSDDDSDDVSEKEAGGYVREAAARKSVQEDAWEEDTAVGSEDQALVTKRVHQLIRYGGLDGNGGVEWVLSKVDQVLGEWKATDSGKGTSAAKDSTEKAEGGEESQKEGDTAEGPAERETAMHNEEVNAQVNAGKSSAEEVTPMETEAGEKVSAERGENGPEQEKVDAFGQEEKKEKDHHSSEPPFADETMQERESASPNEELESPDDNAPPPEVKPSPRADFSIVPMTDLDWTCIENQYVQRLLSALCFKYPRHGSAYWRVPGDSGWEWLDRVKSWVSEARDNVPEDIEDEHVPAGAAKRRARIDWSDDDDDDVRPFRASQPAEGSAGSGQEAPKRRRLMKKGEVQQDEEEERRARARAEARLAKEQRREEKRLARAKKRAELEREGATRPAARARAPRAEKKGPVKKRVRREVPELEPDSDVDMDDVMAFLAKESADKKVRDEAQRVKDELAEKERQERVARGEEEEPTVGKKRAGKKAPAARKNAPSKKRVVKKRKPTAASFIDENNTGSSSEEREPGGEASEKESAGSESEQEKNFEKGKAGQKRARAKAGTKKKTAKRTKKAVQSEPSSSGSDASLGEGSKEEPKRGSSKAAAKGKGASTRPAGKKKGKEGRELSSDSDAADSGSGSEETERPSKHALPVANAKAGAGEKAKGKKKKEISGSESEKDAMSDSDMEPEGVGKKKESNSESETSSSSSSGSSGSDSSRNSSGSSGSSSSSGTDSESSSSDSDSGSGESEEETAGPAKKAGAPAKRGGPVGRKEIQKREKATAPKKRPAKKRSSAGKRKGVEESGSENGRSGSSRDGSESESGSSSGESEQPPTKKGAKGGGGQKRTNRRGATSDVSEADSEKEGSGSDIRPKAKPTKRAAKAGGKRGPAKRKAQKS